MRLIAGLREIDALIKLVRQLSDLPFQKTVLLMGTGLTRPPDQLNDWRALSALPRKARLHFTAWTFMVWAFARIAPPRIALPPLLHRPHPSPWYNSREGSAVGNLSCRSRGSKHTPARRGCYIGASQAGPLMESMHQTDYVRFAVSSANAQEALRELSEPPVDSPSSIPTTQINCWLASWKM